MAEELTAQEKEYLDKKFESFALEFGKRFKIPVIGLAIVFAGLVSIFAAYLYMQAKINVMEAQASFAEAKTSFYESMQSSKEAIANMVKEYNSIVEEAGISVEMMKTYEEEYAKLCERNKAKLPAGENKKPDINIPPPPDPSLGGGGMGPSSTRKDMFKINPQQQQQFVPLN